jgi:hypothetical protein
MERVLLGEGTVAGARSMIVRQRWGPVGVQREAEST